MIERTSFRRFWLLPLAALTGIAAAVFLAGYLIDFYATPGLKQGLAATLFGYDLGTCQNALANLAQVIAAILGIAITVVSIIVQLAATRYTPRVAEMFFRDRTNVGVMTFFVVSCIDALWVSISVTQDLLPRVSITIAMALHDPPIESLVT